MVYWPEENQPKEYSIYGDMKMYLQFLGENDTIDYVLRELKITMTTVTMMLSCDFKPVSDIYNINPPFIGIGYLINFICI